ncbi:MAG: EAL domain-containing protein, partial [Kineosporiaceae bacterium]
MRERHLAGPPGTTVPETAGSGASAGTAKVRDPGPGPRPGPVMLWGPGAVRGPMTGPGWVCALSVSGALLAIGWFGSAHTRPEGLGGFVSLPWWVLAMFFAVTLASPVRLQRTVGGAPAVIGLEAVPLAAGLFLAAPLHLFAGRVVATFLVEVLHRRRGVRTTAIETGAAAAGTGTALTAFGLLLTLTPLGSSAGTVLLSAEEGPAGLGLLSALGALLGAVLLATSVEVGATSVLPGCRREPTWSQPGWVGEPPTGALSRLVLTAGVAVVSAVAGLACVVASPDGRAALTLGVTGSVALLVHQVFASLADQRSALERLYELSDVLAQAQAPAQADVVTVVLERSLALLRADATEVFLTVPQDGPVRWWLQRGWVPHGPERVGGDGRSPTRRGGPPLEGGPGPALGPGPGPGPGSGPLPGAGPAPGGGPAPGERESRLVAALRTPAGDGSLVVWRIGGRGFRPEEARLLETVANHASMALRNGQLIERLHDEARRDELTGLPNRLGLRETLDEAADLALSGGRRCAVMLLDFDGFKAINDTLGHAAGDELLQVLAERLDVVARGQATVARLGGDEFAVLTTRAVTEPDALALARTMLTVFDEPVEVAGSRLRVGGSLGIALGPRHGATGSDLMRNADIAMYVAKQAGGGLQLFSADLVQDSTETVTLAGDLQDAIRRAELDVQVQPIVDLGSGGVHSVEVLARWHHAELGEVAPETLFRAAEHSGLVPVLSAYILDRALALGRGWLDEGRRVRVAVNLASRWLADPGLPDQVWNAMQRFGVPPDLVCLELTERGVIADPRRVGQTLERLRATGVHLAVDDFGTGYSSLTYLSGLPVDQLKIDQEFIRGMQGNERDLAIVRSIVDLGRNLGLEVVAEGVSDRAAQRALLGMGCRLAQGYLFSRPIDPGAFPQYLDMARQRVPGPRPRPRWADAPFRPPARSRSRPAGELVPRVVPRG